MDNEKLVKFIGRKVFNYLRQNGFMQPTDRRLFYIIEYSLNELDKTELDEWVSSSNSNSISVTEKEFNYDAEEKAYQRRIGESRRRAIIINNSELDKSFFIIAYKIFDSEEDVK